MDLTELRTEVDRLLTKAVDLRLPYQDREDFVDTMLDASNAIDQLVAVLDDFDLRVGDALNRAGVVTKRCAWCGRWMVVGTVGRPRRTCRDACRTALARAR